MGLLVDMHDSEVSSFQGCWRMISQEMISQQEQYDALINARVDAMNLHFSTPSLWKRFLLWLVDLFE